MSQFSKVTERFGLLVKRPLEWDVSSEVMRYFVVRQRFETRQYVCR